MFSNIFQVIKLFLYGLKVEFNSTTIRWYIDSKLYSTVNRGQAWNPPHERSETGASGRDQWPQPTGGSAYAKAEFHEVPYYLIMNTAVGGPDQWAKAPDPDFISAEHTIDYVRVSQKQ